MGRSNGRSALALPALVIIVIVVAFIAFAPDEGTDSGTNSDLERETSTSRWHAVTDRKWPPGKLADNQDLDVHRGRTNITVVLDMSGSMNLGECAGDHATKAGAALAALKTWVKAVPRDVNLGLIAFHDDRINTLIHLGTDNRERFIDAARSIGPSGGTPLRSSMKTARKMLVEQARLQQGYGRYQIVMITDGEHSYNEDPSPIVESIVKNPANPVEIHTIGFCIDDSALNKPGIVHYQSAHDPKQLAEGLSSVLAESTSFQPVEAFDEK